MKAKRASLIVCAWLCLPGAYASAEILAGPIVNPANGHTYYLLDAKGWPASEAEAVSLGGHLVTIDDADEDAWVGTTFFPLASGQGNLWIGLNDAAAEGSFVWSSGSGSAYRNWSAGQPDDLGANEDYAHIFGPGRAESPAWNDFNADGAAPTLSVPHGVVEVAPATVPLGSTLLRVALALLLLGTGLAWARPGARGVGARDGSRHASERGPTSAP